MPQHCATSMPWRCSSASISERGGSVPATSAARSAGSLRPLRSRWSTRVIQTVGTQAAMVTRSAAMHLVELVGLEVAAGQHQPVAAERRGIDHLPAVAVEHRRDRHHDLARARAVAADHVGRAHDQRAQDGRAMRVDHALGLAGGARGVADHRGLLLVELRPVVVVVLGREQLSRSSGASGSSCGGSGSTLM